MLSPCGRVKISDFGEGESHRFPPHNINAPVFEARPGSFQRSINLDGRLPAGGVTILSIARFAALDLKK
jgi:hypothetical protein